MFYKSPPLPDGSQIKLSVPVSWGTPEFTMHEEDLHDLWPMPRRVELTFPEKILGQTVCPTRVHLSFIREQDFRRPAFREYHQAVQSLERVLRDAGNVPGATNPPHLPTNTEFHYPVSLKPISTQDGRFQGIRYLANVTQAVAADISYNAFLLSADRQYLFELFAKLDCGVLSEYGAQLVALPGEYPNESFRVPFDRAVAQPRIQQVAQTLDTIVASVMIGP
jgi:hypothetical protein